LAFNLILLIEMGVLDIILGGLMLYGLSKGLRNGLLIELGTFVSVVIGLFLASKFSGFTKTLLEGSVLWNPETTQIAAFVITFIIAVVGISLLAKSLTSAADAASLGSINTLGGGVLGVLKIVMILGVVMSLFEKSNYNNFLVKKETLNKSFFYKPIQKTGFMVTPVFESGLNTIKKLK